MVAGGWPPAGPRAVDRRSRRADRLLVRPGELAWIGFQPLEAACARIGVAVMALGWKT
jgi:hypothetical protein